MSFEAVDHEIGMAAFICANKRDRILQLLHSVKGRSKILQQLYHFNDWDSNAIVTIAHDHQNPDDISVILKKNGAPKYAYIISSNQSIDANFLNLDEALVTVVKAAPGTFLSCIPGRLGYFEGEHRGDRCILKVINK